MIDPSEKEPIGPSIDQLLASLETIQAQEPVLGSGLIGPIIDDIKDQIIAQTTQPSAEQQDILASWNTLTETTSKLGLEAPAPTPEITDALEAVERYEAVIARVGDIGMEPVSIEPVTEPAPAETAKQAPLQETPLTDPASVDTLMIDEPLLAHPPFEIQRQPARSVTVTNGRREIKVSESDQESTTFICRAIAEAQDGTVKTTDLLRQFIGTSSRELDLALKGKIVLPEVPNLPEARRKKDLFYKSIKALRKNGFIEYERGNLAAKGKPAQSGIVRRTGQITFTEEDTALRIEVERQPYNVHINRYEQAIDNGQDKTTVIERNSEIFNRIVQVLGAIAVQPQTERDKFTRSDIERWVGPVPSIGMELRSVIDAFAGDFPLQAHGSRGGSYYSFDAKSTVEIVDGWPEKPHFHDPVRITIEGNTVTATINGEARTLLDPKTSNVPGVTEENIADLTKRYKALFGTLSLLENETDHILSEDLAVFMADHDASQHEKAKIAQWARASLARLNKLFSEEPVINWKRFGGQARIDLNRQIVIDDIGPEYTDPQDTGLLPQDEMPDDLTLEPTIDNIDQINDTQPEELTVEPRRTATDIVTAIDELDEKSRVVVLRRLTQDGRFEYPRSIVEAAHLLKLLTDPEVKAEIREGSSRFRNHQNDTDFKNFIHEALFSCYIRTRSWGSFDELYEAVRGGKPIDAGTRSMIRSFEKTTQQAIDQSTSIIEIGRQSGENTQNRAFAETAADFLIEGHIPHPKNSIQAVTLLSIFQAHRQKITEGKTNAQFTEMVEEMHRLVGDVLGKGNLLTIMESRASRRTSHNGRAVLISSGEEKELRRTDQHRFPDGGTRRIYRKRR